MTGIIRKHQGWLLAVVSTFVVLSFVAFGPTTSARMGDILGGLLGRRQATGAFGSLGGKPIDRQAFLDARRCILLDYLLRTGSLPDGKQANFNESRETYNFLFVEAKADQMGIEVSPKTCASYARDVLGPATFDTLKEKLLQPQGFTVEDFERFVRHAVRMQQLTSVAGVTGRLVTPAEAESLYRKEHEEVSTSIVFFNASNFVDKVTLEDGKLAQYYTNFQANYAIPVRRVVEYVEWPATNFLASAKTILTNLETIVEGNYKQGTNFYKEAKTADEAKALVRQEALHGQAMVLARKAAADFAAELDRQPHALPSLAAFAKTKGLTVATTEPFDQDNGPARLGASRKFLQEAFSHTADEPFTGAVEGAEGYYVLGFKSQVDSTIPPLKDVLAKVTADYKQMQAAQLARDLGNTFATSVTNGLAQGKTFAALVKEFGFKAENPPPFSLSTREFPAEFESRINLNLLKQIGSVIETGKASPFIPTAQGGVVVYNAAKVPITPEKLKTELPAFLTYLRQVRANDAANQWFSKQIEADSGFMQTLQSSINSLQGQRGARPPKS